MQENKIKLPNRYNEEVYLEKIEDTKYKLVHKSSYVRLGIIDGVENKETFIEMMRGPRISLKDKRAMGVVKASSMSYGSYIREVET